MKDISKTAVPPEDSGPPLHEQTLRHFGQRFFAEAQSRSAAEAEEFEAWRREQRQKRPWWSRGGEPKAKA